VQKLKVFRAEYFKNVAFTRSVTSMSSKQ